MDKFALYTLQTLTYVFLVCAAVMLISWMASDDITWIISIPSILTSLFFAAISHVGFRLLESIQNDNKQISDQQKIIERQEATIKSLSNIIKNKDIQ